MDGRIFCGWVPIPAKHHQITHIYCDNKRAAKHEGVSCSFAFPIEQNVKKTFQEEKEGETEAKGILLFTQENNTVTKFLLSLSRPVLFATG